MTSPEPESREERRSPWLAVTLLTLAMVGWFVFQTYQLVRERSALQSVRAAQDPTIERAQKLRVQLDTISKKTLELAQQGNSGAAMIVEELARRGVTINPNPPTSPAEPAPSK
jgi:hypothetical protein